jgi:uncharacterized protein YceH (UPF0502 family)
MRLLSTVEARVLGSLVEKESTTPEYYPMTLNALVNACNQKSSRDPVMSLEEMQVLQALARLRDNGIVEERSEHGARVSRYAHHFDRLTSATPAERAVLCVLFLRGPQTPGEIRGRTGRLHDFKTPAEVEAVLNVLMTRPEPLVTKLPRQTGFKENRYAHLFCGPVSGDNAESAAPETAAPAVSPDRLEAIEEKLEALRRDVEAIKARLSGGSSQL